MHPSFDAQTAQSGRSIPPCLSAAVLDQPTIPDLGPVPVADQFAGGRTPGLEQAIADQDLVEIADAL